MYLRTTCTLLALCLALTTSAAPCQGSLHSDSTIPPVWNIVGDGFESGTLADWRAVSIAHLWVDAVHGNDASDGLTAATAFLTIQKAANLAGPGTTVHIMPGIYRETVQPAMSGSASEPALYIAENGRGTAVIRGSEPASSLTWTQLSSNTIGLPTGVDPAKIYYADLSAWGLSKPPRFVVELDSRGEIVARLPLAREPDWPVVREWKYHEFWWAADGGSDVAGCDPRTNPDPRECDRPWRSLTQLTDRSNDTDPAGVEAGNLTTLGDLTGATLVAMDAIEGHDVYRRTIVSHDVAAGRVTVDRMCEFAGNPGLGWGSKYYVEGNPYLLDTPGEWWYDIGSGRLYLWPPHAGNPATMNIEIARRDTGFSLRNRSYTILDGLTIEFLNEDAIYQVNDYDEKSYNNTVRNATLRYANVGLRLSQDVRAGGSASYITDGFTLNSSEIAYMDSHALRLVDWWENDAAADSFTHSGILNTVIRNNELHHLGFRSDGDSAIGAWFQFAHRLRFEGNHVHHVAHNGVQFLRSVIQSPKQYGFTPDEIKTGEILIKDNLFEKACQLTSDCGALKIWGAPPDNHVYRDVLVTGNVFRDTFGWSYVSEKRRYWTDSTGSDVRGMGGFGLYIDMASGLHVYRNIAYNNAFADFWIDGVWRDGNMVLYNNIAANSLHGFSLGETSFDTHESVNTKVVNNIVVNNEGYGILLSDADGLYGNMTLDHNLYYSNGWRPYENGGVWKPGDMAVYRGAAPNEYYQTLSEIQSHTYWERNGIEGDPHFWQYTSTDHDLHDGSWPDFHLTSASDNAIDTGSTNLPTSLTALLTAFGVQDLHWGSALDIGRYEGGFAVLANPSILTVEPGGVVHSALQLYSPDLPFTVTLTVTSPSPALALSLDPFIIPPGQAVLTITDHHTGTLPHGLWYTIDIIGIGGGFTGAGNIGVLVGGTSVYLPLVVRNANTR